MYPSSHITFLLGPFLLLSPPSPPLLSATQFPLSLPCPLPSRPSLNISPWGGRERRSEGEREKELG